MLALGINAALFFLAGLIALAVQVWAAVDCALAKASEFPTADKRTKGFWAGLTAGSVVVGLAFIFLNASSGLLIILNLAACAVAGVYLADVRPALRAVRRYRRGNSGPQSRW